MTTAIVTRNPQADGRAWPQADSTVTDFHRRMPGYASTPLVDAPALAAELGLAELSIKAETLRMGLPSFKILGASWATYRSICDHIGHEPAAWETISDFAAEVAHLVPFTLATATDGNHGRAVAHMARLLGFGAEIFVPTGMAQARIAAIEAEGATVSIVDGDYDDAVVRAAEEAGDRCLVISDTSWPGYEAVPSHVIEGYSTIFGEVDEQLVAMGRSLPDLVVIPMGVGAFMAAAVTHYRSGDQRAVIVGVEPLDANCIQMSMASGELTHVPGPHRSIMVGMNCGFPSPVAWPRLESGVDWSTAVDDDAARQAMRDLAGASVVAGETGAASLAGLRALLDDPAAASALGNRRDLTALIVVTEGATDAAAYEQIVGRSAESVATSG